MTRKVINIESAKLDKSKPLLAMTKREFDATFHHLGGVILEGILAEAERGCKVRLIGVVLSGEGVSDRLVCAYEEYGDGDHVELCEEIVEETTPFLHRGERLRVATFDVNLDLLEPFKFPSKKLWDARERGAKAAKKAWQAYGRLHEARGQVTMVITWAISPAGEKKVLKWDIDYGDGCGMWQYATDTVEGLRWNKLVAPGHKIRLAAYKVPAAALSEISHDVPKKMR